MAKQQQELMSALSSLHIGGKYSDLTVRCGHREWRVHKAILCSRSTFFDGACSGGFSEARSGVIDLSEDDEEAVDHMINYFYHLDYLTSSDDDDDHFDKVDSVQNLPTKQLDPYIYQDPLIAQALALTQASQPPTDHSRPPMHRTASQQSAGTLKVRSKGLSPPHRINQPGSDQDSDMDDDDLYDDDKSHLLAHTRTYALAEKYDVAGLKALAQSKFEISMACYYDSPELPDAIEEVYNSTIGSERGLRNIVLQTFRTHPQLASTQDVFEVIKSTPELALELWKVERGLPV